MTREIPRDVPLADWELQLLREMDEEERRGRAGTIPAIVSHGSRDPLQARAQQAFPNQTTAPRTTTIDELLLDDACRRSAAVQLA